MRTILAGILLLCTAAMVGAEDWSITADSQYPAKATSWESYVGAVGNLRINLENDGVARAVGAGEVLTFWYGTNGLLSDAITQLTVTGTNLLPIVATNFPIQSSDLLGAFTYGLSLDDTPYGHGALKVQPSPFYSATGGMSTAEGTLAQQAQNGQTAYDSYVSNLVAGAGISLAQSGREWTVTATGVGTGDVTQAGNNLMSGSNRFTGKLQITTNVPTAGQIAKYNATDGKWYAATESGGSDTTFTNTINVGGFGLTLTGSATSGSNAINGVADSGFTNAVRSAQTNVVDTDTTFTNSLYADAPITVAGTADGGSNRFGFVYNAAWSNEVQSAQTNPTLTSLGGQPTNANLSGWANISTNGGIDESNLDASVNASLDLADGSLQSDGSVALAGAQSIGNQTLNNLGILYDGNGTGAGINFSGMVVWDSGGNNSADFVDRKLIAEDGTTDILTWTNGLDVLDSSAQNIRDNAVATFDGTQNADEICVITANGITGKTGDELQMLTSGIYTQSFATNISMNLGYKINAELNATNNLTLDIAGAQPKHAFNLLLYITSGKTVTLDSDLIAPSDVTWTAGLTNLLSFTPIGGTDKWLYMPKTID